MLGGGQKEGLVMKEAFVGKCYLPGFDPATYTDPVLEECYRMKQEFNAQFKTVEERHAYLAAQGEKRRKEGYKYLPLPPHLTEYRPKED